MYIFYRITRLGREVRMLVSKDTCPLNEPKSHNWSIPVFLSCFFVIFNELHLLIRKMKTYPSRTSLTNFFGQKKESYFLDQKSKKSKIPTSIKTK